MHVPTDVRTVLEDPDRRSAPFATHATLARVGGLPELGGAAADTGFAHDERVGSS
jgi:hypothetical protein